MKIQEILIEKRCTPKISSAIAEFYDRWGAYSAQSPKRFIFRLLDICIQPKWEKYLRRLPVSHPVRIAFSEQKLSLIARQSGFGGLDEKIRLSINWNDHHVLKATLETLRHLAQACAYKKPKKLDEDLNSGRTDRNPNEFCRFCGNNTELFASIKRKEFEINKLVEPTKYKETKYKENEPGYFPDHKRADGKWPRLSAKYCWDHRQKFLELDKEGRPKRNPKYLAALRNIGAFDLELKRLQLQYRFCAEPYDQSAIDLYPEPPKPDHDINEFYFRVIRPIAAHATYENEKSVLRNEARKLVDAGITLVDAAGVADDTKKRIIMMRARGLNLTEIANLIGMKSPQAVSQALKRVDIDSGYRFDKKKAI